MDWFSIIKPFPSTALLDCTFNLVFAFLPTNAQNNNISNIRQELVRIIRSYCCKDEIWNTVDSIYNRILV
jgi:hypothetical protein